ncbi:dihydrodipicolinate synthase family protein [Bosea caraganae]|uniref:Dihydrodipicolinate synthase family protein n=1 Tax=Bosea caraganae TaxID=2763117 RepID=A0A370KYN4_9HYPH|nr:dihydrodipicolinate synthase family protein [Bosea caraganae]RDJ20103.1 dihydrodipicolinate synthase family protein [Bosea caraganae]RDJ24815.1 dihydrodipicolinate synthase family protein [Bosea caraganae]
MMKKPDFRGVIPALTTPFRHDQSLDADAFGVLAETVIADGVNGLLVNGCTGESWALSDDERGIVFRTAVEAAKGRVPVVAGCSAIFAKEAIKKIEQAAKAGCDVAMVSAPWYIIPGEEEIADHFRQVIQASPLPILLYNIPRRTGVHLSLNLIDRLADEDKVVAIKESSKDWGTLSSVIRLAGDRISVFAGYASFFGLAAISEGAVGYMDSGTPVFGATSPQFYKAATTGDLATARRIQAEMANMLASFFGLGTFPASVKASLDLIGRPGGRTRDPIRPLTEAQREQLRAVMESSGFLERARAA